MDISEMIQYLLTPMAQVALIIGLAEIVKRLGVDTKYIPLIDLGLGLVSGIFIYYLAMNYGIVESVLVGIALGLSACGLFSGVKNILEERDADEI